MRLPSARVVSRLTTKSPLRGAPFTAWPSPNSLKNISPPGPGPCMNITSFGGGGGGADCPNATATVNRTKTAIEMGLIIPSFINFIRSTSSPLACVSLVHNSHGSHQSVIPDDHVGDHRLIAMAIHGGRSAPRQFHANDLFFARTN